jgi:hypothetical protein
MRFAEESGLRRQESGVRSQESDLIADPYPQDMSTVPPDTAPIADAATNQGNQIAYGFR